MFKQPEIGRRHPTFDAPKPKLKPIALVQLIATPDAFEGTQCFLYHNEGHGRFEDVSGRAGIHVTGTLDRPIGKSLAVCVCDVDDDG